MKVYNKSHIYEVLPPFMDNRKLMPIDDRIVVGLTVAVLPEQDAYQREMMQIRAEFAIDKAQELIEEKTHAFIAKHFKFVKGLEIEGFEGKELDFNTFYVEAPPEIVTWVTRAIMSTTELSQAERKNF